MNSLAPSKSFSVFPSLILVLHLSVTLLAVPCHVSGQGEPVPVSIAGANDIPVNVTRLGGRSVLVRLSDNPGATNVTAVASADGLIVVDTEMAQRIAAALKEAITGAFDRADFKYVISTHSHWDHTLGNAAFAGAQVVAHDMAVDEMREFVARRLDFATRLQEGWIDLLDEEYRALDPQSDEGKTNRRRALYSSMVVDELRNGFSLSLPTLTFSDKLTLHLSDMTVEVACVGKAHSASDIVIRFDAEHLLAVGDLFSARALPYVDGGMDVPRFLEALDGLLEGSVEIRYVIPGHGALMNAAELRVQRDYMRWLLEGVRLGREEGLSLEEVQERLALSNHPVDLSHLSHTWGDGTDFHQLNIQNLWSVLDASLTP